MTKEIEILKHHNRFFVSFSFLSSLIKHGFVKHGLVRKDTIYRQTEQKQFYLFDYHFNLTFTVLCHPSLLLLYSLSAT